jgi:hypothetical protein
MVNVNFNSVTRCFHGCTEQITSGLSKGLAKIMSTEDRDDYILKINTIVKDFKDYFQKGQNNPATKIIILSITIFLTLSTTTYSLPLTGAFAVTALFFKNDLKDDLKDGLQDGLQDDPKLMFTIAAGVAYFAHTILKVGTAVLSLNPLGVASSLVIQGSVTYGLYALSLYLSSKENPKSDNCSFRDDEDSKKDNESESV